MSGKTTSLRSLFKYFNIEENICSIETSTGRTLFFDFGVISLKGGSWNIKISLYSATGQDFYASTRPATLAGTDGIIFVVDSRKEHIEEKGNAKGRSFSNQMVYEYQLLQENQEIDESRVLLEYRHKRCHKENSPLRTTSYRYNKLIFGPIGLFSKGWQKHFHYRFLGEESLKENNAYIIEAIPLRQMMQNYICARIWIDSRNFSVQKIQWEPKFFIDNINEAVDRSYWESGKLQIDFISEFDVEKNGIRFPSRYYIAEYIIDEMKKKKLHTKIQVIFKDFSFFSVGSDVIYQ